MLRKQPLIEDIFHPMLIIPWAPIYQEYIHELSKVGYLWTWFPILYYYVPWREFIGPDSDLLEEREGEKGLLKFFGSVPSNIIHKLQIYYFINLWYIILQKKNLIFCLEYDKKGKYLIKLKGYKISNLSLQKVVVPLLKCSYSWITAFYIG